MDDGADPSRQQSLVQQEVEQNHVLAFVQMNAPLTGQASVSYLAQRQIPVIGNEGASPWFYQNPTYFPQSPTADKYIETAIASTGDYSRAHAMPKVGTLSCIESSVCSRMYVVAGNLAQQYGMTLVYRGQASIVQPDYTSSCQSAKDAGAQILLIALDTNSILRIVRSCESVNYHPQYSIFGIAASPDLAQNASVTGAIIGSSVVPPEVTNHPAVVQYRNAIKQYAPGAQPSPTGMVGWVSAKIFELAAQNLPEPPTSQAIVHGLYSIKDNDLGGLTYPLTYTRGQNAPAVECHWNLQIQGGQYVSTDAGVRHCP